MEGLSSIMCTGCGVPLQTDNPGVVGYTPASALAKEHPICQRCFRIKNYGEVAPVSIDVDSFRELVGQVRQTKALVIHVLDIFDVSGSWVDGFEKLVGNNPIVLVSNKVDLLPRQTNLVRTEQWLREQVEKKGLQVAGVVLVSARTGLHIENVKTWVERYATDRDIYVVGTSNVGKSTLINRLIGKLSEGNQRTVELTTSRFPGTTLSTVAIEIPGYQHHLIDTPGIMTTHRLSDVVSLSTLKMITPDKTLNPTIFQINDQQTLFVGGLVRVDFVKGPRQSIVCYFANQLEVHRTKLENADELYNKHLGELLRPPTSEDPDGLRQLVSREYKFSPGAPMDLVVAGLGWVSLRGEAAVIRIHVPRGIHVSLRKAII